jgi:hypothetical protein
VLIGVRLMRSHTFFESYALFVADLPLLF